MKHIKKFESFSVNEELVSAIEVQAYKRMTQEIKTVLIDLEESEKATVDEPKGYYPDAERFYDTPSYEDQCATAKWKINRILKDWKRTDRDGDMIFDYMDEETKKRFNDLFINDNPFLTNEEVSFKGIAAGAMMALMTACHNGEVNGEASDVYTGDMLVKRIEMGGGKHNFFLVHGEDEQGKHVEFATDNLTFNVGDSIHVNFDSEEAYPLDDRSNVAEIGS
jgi:hypothetical protein